MISSVLDWLALKEQVDAGRPMAPKWSVICFSLRQIRLEKELKSLLWKIDYSEIMIKRSDSGYSVTTEDNLGLATEIQVPTT